MDYIRKLVREAHRRSLWQVLGVYLALSWGVFQVVKELTDFVDLPDWVPGMAIVLLLIGLPIVLATAFVQEGGPGNTPAAPDVDPTLLPMSIPSQPEPRRSHILFTWKKAVLGGICAFLLLGITAGGYMGMRNAGVGPFGSLVASGELDSRERILIAEFEPLNGDTVLARTVTEAFRVDFSQSPMVTVLQPNHVRAVLQRMSRPHNTRIDAGLAHEIARRDNIKAYLTGELSQVGGKYLLAAKLIATADSRVLASYRETASSADDVINAVDRLSKKLREKIGDSFRTIRAEKPLERVSTPSFEALQKYTQATYVTDVEGDLDTGAQLLEEAIALDTAFAMAWRKLAVTYINLQASTEKQLQAIHKAYTFRDRLTDAERLEAEGLYYYVLKRDYERARRAYEQLLEVSPATPPINLGSVYAELKQYRKAADTYERALQIDSTVWISLYNLPTAFTELGMRDSAEHYVRVFAERFGAGRPEILQRQTAIAFSFRDWDRLAELTRPTPAEARSAWLRRSLYQTRTDLALVHGRIRESQRHRALLVTAEEEAGNPAIALTTRREEARFAFFALRDPARARSVLDAALREHPLERFPVLDRPYLELAMDYALFGNIQRARSLLAQWEQNVPVELRADEARERDFIEGAIALHEGRYADAINYLRRAANRDPCEFCTDSELALAFRRAGQPDSAIARLEHYVSKPSFYAATADPFKLASAYEDLADLYAARGDNENARRYAGMFVSLWQGADPELQPRVRAKQEMLRALN